MTTAVRLQEHQITAAGEAMGRAFFDDPLQKYSLPDDETRRALSPAFFSALLRGHLFADIYTSPDVAGAAVGVSPGGLSDAERASADAGIEAAGKVVGVEALSKFGAVMEFLEPFHQRDAPEDHWYLAVIGVDSSQQGIGIGCALMEPVLRKADENGSICYLETAQPKNVGFYKRRGFDVIVDTVDPTSGLRLWTFRREPRS